MHHAVSFSGMMIAENCITDIAVVLEKEPNDVRYANLFKDGQKTHYNQTIEGDSLDRCLLECLKQSEYEKTKTKLNDFNEGNKWKKRGVAIIPVMHGLAFMAPFMNQAGSHYIAMNFVHYERALSTFYAGNHSAVMKLKTNNWQQVNCGEFYQ